MISSVVFAVFVKPEQTSNFVYFYIYSTSGVLQNVDHFIKLSIPAVKLTLNHYNVSYTTLRYPQLAMMLTYSDSQ